MPPSHSTLTHAPPISKAHTRRTAIVFASSLAFVPFADAALTNNPDTKSKIDLTGSLFEKQGTSTGTDPLLLYSIALAESGYCRGKGKIGPWPWTLRSNKAHYPESREAAEIKLNELIKSYGRVIDIGLCQANLFWHGHRVNKPEDLLDPQTNLRVANQVLLESIA